MSEQATNAPRAGGLPPSEPSRLAGLVRLRWASLVSQLALVLGIRFGLAVPVPLDATLALLAGLAASNVALAIAARRLPRAERLVGPTLLTDCALLTALLYLSGGAANPFSVLYLVQVTLAAVSASSRWTLSVVLAAILGYALLFYAPELPGMTHGGHGAADASTAHGPAMGEPGHDHAAHVRAMLAERTAAADPFSAHLRGMWLAFALAAALIAYFASGVARSLAEERERAARSARLVALSTLAAGAAHELLTPLGTIKLAAGEIERALEAHAELAHVRDDARLVVSEVARSRDILDRLRADTGELAGEPVEPVTLEAIEREVRAALGASAERISVRCAEPTTRALAPRRALAFAVASLIRNALDASAPGATVEVELGHDARGIVLSVRDRGRGMSEEELARAGEPFYTTKEPGRGMGLGVFIARSLAQQLGGDLELRSRAGDGTTATLHVPRAPEGRPA